MQKIIFENLKRHLIFFKKNKFLSQNQLADYGNEVVYIWQLLWKTIVTVWYKNYRVEFTLNEILKSFIYSKFLRRSNTQ